MNFTPKQLQYLFYMDHYRNSKRLISDLAEQLGVSKPAVSQVLDFHEKNGLIRRCANGSIALAREAEDAIAELRKKYEIILPFFGDMPNLTGEAAVKSALQYICWMPPESVAGLIQELKEKDEFSRIRWDLDAGAADRPFPFPDGRYQVPFDVYKADRNEISMGDRGFVKPARMVVLDGRGVITLESKEIRYQSELADRFRGKLTCLSCLHGVDFVRVKPRSSEYTLPLHYIRKMSTAPDGMLCGTLRIRAETSKCVANMPISEADIVFRFVQFAKFKKNFSGQVKRT